MVIRSDKKQLTLKEDLLESAVTGMIGTVEGLMATIVYPDEIPNIFREIRKGYVENLNTFFHTVGHFGGYLTGVGVWTYNLVQNIDNPLAWAPVVTNLVSGATIIAYRKGKQRAKLNHEKDDLELKVSQDI